MTENTTSARFPDMSIEASQLLTKLCNATRTYYCCNGHSKAERNEYWAKQYKQELEAMGVTIPPEYELLKLGVFNGEGSY